MVVFSITFVFMVSVRDCRDGDTKRGDVGLIKVKKEVDFKIHFR